MAVNDSIGDMLARIRNGSRARLKTIDIPASRMKLEIAKVLLRHRLIANYKYLDDRKQGIIRIFLKFNEEEQGVISGMKRISRPGLRVHLSVRKIPKVRGGFGLAILTTSKGIKTDQEARRDGIGGEVLCTIW